MAGQVMAGRWRPCAGCGRERRLARGGAVICEHNRWDSARGAMVACEGSGQPPGPHAGPVIAWCSSCPQAAGARRALAGLAGRAG